MKLYRLVYHIGTVCCKQELQLSLSHLMNYLPLAKIPNWSISESYGMDKFNFTDGYINQDDVS